MCIRWMWRQIIANAPVCEHYALGLARGAGGVDHIGKIVRAYFDIGILGVSAA